MSYHGCILKNADGSNKIIFRTDKCVTPTDKCMWKYPWNVPNGVKTRSKTKNGPTVGYKEVNNYFAAKYFTHRRFMGKEDRFFCEINIIWEYTIF